MTDETKDKKEKQQEGGGRTSGKTGHTASQKSYPVPKMDFSTFILSLNSSALVQLGLIEDPATGQKTKNIPLAKQTIDLLAMLEEKTQGNLTGDEATIMKNILYELRLLYIKEKG